MSDKHLITDLYWEAVRCLLNLEVNRKKVQEIWIIGFGKWMNRAVPIGKKASVVPVVIY
jgi:hypothetical protein